MARESAIKKYKLKSGKTRYYFHTYIGLKSNGKKAFATKRGFKTYSEAYSAYKDIRANGLKSLVDKRQTINEVYNMWFKSYKSTVKVSSANKVNQIYHNHIEPVFGNRFLDDITVAELQKYADQKAQEIVKYKDAIRQINQLFEYGLRMGFVNENPIRRIIIPKKTARKRRDTEHNVYSRKELEDFLKAASKEPINIYTYFMVLAHTGLRKSEALALTWNDIDLNKRTLKVNKTLAVGFNNQQLVQPPKSKNSNRTIPISNDLLKCLKKYKAECKTDKLFCTKAGYYLRISKPNSWLTSIYHQNPGLRKITLHGFRHTFATLLAEETNIKPKTLQMLMGHENIQITFNIYAHINSRNKTDAIQAIQKLNL